MKTAEIKKLKEVIEDIEKDFSFSDYIFNYVDEDELKELSDIAEVKQYIENLNEDRDITNAEIIYYSAAIDYLKENDPSLRESLEIAEECDYTLDKISSELLASLLVTRQNEEDFNTFLDELETRGEDIFN